MDATVVEDGYHVTVQRCALCCLHLGYESDARSFYTRFLDEWAVGRLTVFYQSDVAVFGRLQKNRTTRRPAPVPPLPSGWLERANASASEERVARYVLLFEECLRRVGFDTPVSSRALRGNVPVYQEVGMGTCWLVAALNLLLHIPETRIPLWNALGVKRPTHDDTLATTFFVRSDLGRRVFAAYARFNRRDATTYSDEELHGGNPHALVKAIATEVGLPLEHTYHLQEDEPDDILASLDDTLRTYRRVAGFILVGYRATDRRSGHAIAIVRDADDPDRAVVMNLGAVGGKAIMDEFLRKYTTGRILYAYTVSTARGRLSLPESSPPRRTRAVRAIAAVRQRLRRMRRSK